MEGEDNGGDWIDKEKLQADELNYWKYITIVCKIMINNINY